MIGLLQRVTQASVTVEGERIAEIAMELLVLVGVEAGDEAAQAERLAHRLLDYRVFPDDAGRMNRSVREANGELLLVPQFTLAADTDKGTRPGFSSAAPPDVGRQLFHHLVRVLERQHAPVATGRFGADMKVALVNDGPVTFLLRVRPPPARHYDS